HTVTKDATISVRSNDKPVITAPNQDYKVGDSTSINEKGKRVIKTRLPQTATDIMSTSTVLVTIISLFINIIILKKHNKKKQ
ncbi:hypothetical protein, partial [Leuconostoc mesenteroides]|uniref:hypothetical protein n=1 Tax=Leuconostoc mesenteroides TaxID=1245 RepID=UPI001416F61C